MRELFSRVLSAIAERIERMNTRTILNWLLIIIAISFFVTIGYVAIVPPTRIRNPQSLGFVFLLWAAFLTVISGIVIVVRREAPMPFPMQDIHGKFAAFLGVLRILLFIVCMVISLYFLVTE